MSILLVSDNIFYRELLDTLLHKEGYTELLHTSTTAETHKLLQQSPDMIDLVVLALQLPDADKQQDYQKLKARLQLSNVPFLVVLPKHHPDLLREAMSSGAWDYIIAPPNPIEFSVRIQAALKFKAAVDRQKLYEQQLRAELHERHRIGRALQRSEVLCRALVDNFPHSMVCLFDRELRCFVSGGSDHSQSAALNQILSNSAGNGNDLEQRQTIEMYYQAALEGRTNTFDITYLDHHYRMRVLPISDEQDEVIAGMAIIQNVTHHRAQAAEIERLAYTDSLTGVANRVSLFRAGERVLTNPEREHEILALLFIDLDHFKTVNDTLGHDMGDILLVQVAERLQASVRSHDTLARLGGDEFALLLRHTTREQAVAIAERVGRLLRHPFDLQGHLIYLSGSIGVAVRSPLQRNFGELLSQADMAMYQAKNAGGGVYLYEEELLNQYTEQLRYETDFQSALRTDELILYYQPIFDLASSTIVGIEALVRWEHPTNGLLLPHLFLPLIRNALLLRDLDHLVLRQAFQQLHEWQSEGWTPQLSINISVQSLNEPQFIAELEALLKTHNIQPTQIVLEVTEHSTLLTTHSIRDVLDHLKALGISIALDNFGNGTASLTNLQTLNSLDILKVDRSLVAELGQHTRAEALVQALLSLGDTLGVRVIIEGIEEQSQLDWLRSVHGNLVQGYLIGPPMRPEDLRDMVLARVLPAASV